MGEDQNNNNNNNNKVNKAASRSSGSMPDVVLDCVMPYIHDPRDRDAASLVCRRWYELEALTRKHVTIATCYAARPDQLRRRFRSLESLKIKGKPRAAMFNLIQEDWGGFAAPWVEEIAESFNCLRSLHFRRMIVKDSDLELLAGSRGRVLKHLKLDNCSGFSTDGLLHVGRSCRQLRTLFLEESSILEKDGDWLRELAMNNKVLETLNFYRTDLNKIRYEDLELIAKNCHSLVSVKISDCELLDLVGFFRTAAALEEFCGASFNDQPDKYSSVKFPETLHCLGLTYMGKNEMQIVFPFASLLKKLDLLYAFLDMEDHCHLIQRCPNLEVLETRDVIGDRVLEVLARSCKRLKRLRIEHGADDERGVISHRGIISLAQGCLELEYLAVYVCDITNEALESVGTYSKNLNDFRLALIVRNESITDLPLDNGVRALLRGCEKLQRFALCLRQGGLTDVGLSYIGQYSRNVRWMLFCDVGESDDGLIEFSKGCPSLKKLEIRGSCFSENALARAATQLPSLRYLWVQGYRRSSLGSLDLIAMARPFWNIELVPSRKVVVVNQVGDNVLVEHLGHILAYFSIAGPRTDFPRAVVPLYPMKLKSA